MVINVTSFGYRYGLPVDADLVFDVRFLPNPYFVENLKNYDGHHADVTRLCFEKQRKQGIFEKNIGFNEFTDSSL